MDSSNTARNLFENLLKYGVIHSCLNCQFWNDGEEFCNQWQAKPPLKVITFGCEYWNCHLPF